MMEQTNTPYATKLKELGELENYIGKELGLTEWMTIEQERINSFAESTEDRQWIHIDPERSTAFSPYKKTVAHGFLVLSLASKISYDAFSIENIAMGVNYGLDKVRFPNATKSSVSKGLMKQSKKKEACNGYRSILCQFRVPTCNRF